MMILPTDRHLRRYKNRVPQDAGPHDEVFLWLQMMQMFLRREGLVALFMMKQSSAGYCIRYERWQASFTSSHLVQMDGLKVRLKAMI
ncbi:hypothetical protein ACJMK2_018233 [Sinanodonta woodiana]|uniref:Uncharacterized protein n=1 Tax=Sinanodonta woodiana TaxID=1069815 RepID=A0ABD3UFU6_SINWO